jgi:hypothetical protein
MSHRQLPGYLALILLVAACSAPTAPGAQRDQGAATPGAEAPRPVVAQRITLAITTEPTSLYYALIPSPVRASPGSIQELVSPGLAVFDNYGVLRPIAVEAIPTIENGQ